MTAFCIGLTGAASAASINVSTQGPNSGVSIKSSGGSWQGSTTSYTGSSNSHSNDGWQGGWSDGSDWGGHDPMMWQNKNMSCDNWWGDMMQTMSHYKASNWQRNNDNDRNWQPTGDNWQASWSNWNPMMWQEHNQSYGHWYAQMTSYMNRNHTKWQNEWKGHTQETSHEQNDENSNNRQVNENRGDNDRQSYDGNVGNGYQNHNQTTTYVHPEESRGASNTGPIYNNSWNNSTNDWDHMPAYLNTSYLNSRRNTISNWVSVSNNNSQSVRSGNASSWGNTYSGDVRSGDANASNEVSISLSI
jgi:hypothetical protein